MAVAVLAASTGAQAQERQEGRASPTGKGIVGGALLGAEIAVLATAALEAESDWAYWTALLVGAGAGGLGGFFVEESLNTRVSFYLLAGGMGLVIPASIVFIDSTVYRAPPEVVRDQALRSLPPLVASKRRGQWSTATVVSINEQTTSLGVPAVAVTPIYTPQEQQELGVQSGTQVVVPVVGGLF